MGFQISGEWIFNGVVGIAVTFVGFWLRSVKEELTNIKAECKEIRGTYQSKELAAVSQAHQDAILQEIRSELKALNNKLDRKIDK